MCPIMDSHVTADSLSPENGITSEPSAFGVGMLSSFSTREGDRRNSDASYGDPRGASPLDSFDLSPATDGTPFSAAGRATDFLADSTSRSGSQVGDGFKPLREDPAGGSSSNLVHRDSSDRPRVEHYGQVGADDESKAVSSRTGGHENLLGIASAPGNQRSWDVPNQGYGILDRRLRQPRNHRLESSWPLIGAAGCDRDKREGDSWDHGTHAYASPSVSGRRLSSDRGVIGNLDVNMIDSPSMARSQQPVESNRVGESSKSPRPLWGTGQGTQLHVQGNHVHDSDQRGNGGNDADGGNNEDSCSGEGGSSSNNGNRWGGAGWGDTLSASDVSSGGVPAPPTMPSGSLPAMASLKEVTSLEELVAYVLVARIKRAELLRPPLWWQLQVHTRSAT